MPLRSVFEVDVDDQKFQAFVDSVNKYKTIVQSIPNLWGQQSASVNTIHQNLTNVTSVLMAHNQLMHQIAYQTGQVASATSGMGRAWGGIVVGAKSFVGHLENAVVHLGRFAGVGFGLMGLGIGGGLFGIEHLAASVAGGQRTARGLLSSTGGMMAADVELGQTVDPRNFLSNIANAATDVTKQGWLGVLGLNQGIFAGGDTSKAIPTVFQALWKWMHATTGGNISMLGPMMDNILSPLGFNMPVEDSRRLFTTPYAQVPQIVSKMMEDRNKFNLSNEDQQKWTNFHTQLERAGKTIFTTFVQATANLAPQFESLSKTVTDVATDFIKSDGFKALLEGATGALKDFDSYLKSEQFTHDVKTFIWGVHTMAAGFEVIKEAISTFKAWITMLGIGPPDDLHGNKPKGFIEGLPDPKDWWRSWQQWWHNSSLGGGANITGSQIGPILSVAQAAGAGNVAQEALLAAAASEGGLGETWKTGDHGTSFGPWQLHQGGELNRYLEEGNRPGDIVAQTKFVLKRLEEIYPGFSKITDPDLAARIIARFEHGVLTSQDYGRNFPRARQVVTNYQGNYTSGGSDSPNVQQNAPITIHLHGATGAVDSTISNAVAGGVG